MKSTHIITTVFIALLLFAGAGTAAESLYEGSITVITADGTATVEYMFYPPQCEPTQRIVLVPLIF